MVWHSCAACGLKPAEQRIPKKGAELPKPTAAEPDLVRVIGRLGPATVKDLHAELLSERPDLTHATVWRRMQVMHGKGLLTRDESERPHIYAAAPAQDALQSSLLGDLIQKTFSGSAKHLVLSALRNHVRSKKRDEIRRFLAEHPDE